MKRKTIVFLLFLLFIGLDQLSAMAPPARAWQSTIGGSGSDNGTKMIADDHGGFWLLGTTDSNNGDITFNNGSTDVLLVHSASDGTVLSVKTYGGTGIDIGNDLLLLASGQLVIAGYSNSNSFAGGNYGGYDGFLLCVDTNGSVVWTSRFGGANADLLYQVISSPTGFILTGGTYSSTPGNSNRGDQDLWLVKTDLNGLVQWQKNYGGSSLDIGYASVLSGNEIITSGLTLSNNQDVSGNHGGLDAWLIKVDPSSGAVNWQRCYGGTANDASFSLKLLNSGDLAFAGYSRSSNGDLSGNYGFNDAWIATIDVAGNIINQKNFGGSASDAIYSIDETTDGILLSCASTSNDQDVPVNSGGEDVWMVKVDFSLNMVWSKSFGGSGNDRPASIMILSGDELSICGYSFSNNGDVAGNHGNSDLWLFHIACLSPSMTISGNFSTACAGDTVRLVNRSANVGAFQWYLNNTRMSAADTLQLNINTPGNYVVSLSGQTCQNTDSTAYPFLLNNCSAPSADFICDVTSVCEGGTVQFLDRSYMPSSYLWQFPGGNPSMSTDPNPVVTYASSGYYEATLTVFNAYGNSTLFRPQAIYVNPLPTPPSITVTGNDLYCNTTLPILWYWQNQVIAFDPYIFNVADGFYNAIVTDSNGCSISTDTVQVLTSSIAEGNAIGLSYYPNPATDYLKVDAKEDLLITVRDASGRVVINENIEKGISTINLSAISNGVYTIAFKGKTISVVRPLIHH